MKTIECTKCGSSDFTVNDGQYVCDYCKSKHVPDAGDLLAKETVIAMNSDIEILLQKCRDDPSNKKRYASLVLDIDPTNQEAYKHLR